MDIPPEIYDFSRSGHGFERRREFVAGCLKEIRPKKVLELGCGTGALLSSLSGVTGAVMVGSELTQNFIDYAKKHHKNKKVRFVRADFMKKPPREKFDAVITVDVIHHFDLELGVIIRKIKKMLRPGGHWIIVDHNILNPYIFLWQKLAEHRTFDFARFEATAGLDFTMIRKKLMITIPSSVKNPPKLLKRLELLFEKIPVFAGSRGYVYKVKK